MCSNIIDIISKFDVAIGICSVGSIEVKMVNSFYNTAIAGKLDMLILDGFF